MTFLEIKIEDIYGILAAPPCTMFSIARIDSTAKIPRDFHGGMVTVEACMKIIWEVRKASKNLTFWALENPRGYLRQFLGKPPYEFMQWEFGGDRDKPTDLWGYFNKPTKKFKTKPLGMKSVEWGREKVGNGLDRASVRAITPESFANAFYKANK